MYILELINEIKNSKDCFIYPPCGIPVIGENVKLPSDLKKFYEVCGGIDLFKNKQYGFEIVKPKEFVLANPLIIGELCEEDISSKWYIICKDSEDNYITIDLYKEKNGRCYDSFWDRHGVVGECSVIAISFTELIERLFRSKGKSLYWLDDNFEYIGDAYDEL